MRRLLPYLLVLGCGIEVASARAELPDPFDKLDLTAQQEKQVQIVVNKYAHAKLDNNLVRDKMIGEVDRILNDDQKTKYAELRKQMDEGVPLGDGLFRSYKIRGYHPSSGGGSAHIGDPREIWYAVQRAALNEGRSPYREGAAFTITNRSGKICRSAVIIVEALDEHGTRILSTTESIADLADGQSQEVHAEFDRTADNVKKINVRLSGNH